LCGDVDEDGFYPFSVTLEIWFLKPGILQRL
jgi:hypothetical protein